MMYDELAVQFTITFVVYAMFRRRARKGGDDRSGCTNLHRKIWAGKPFRAPQQVGTVLFWASTPLMTKAAAATLIILKPNIIRKSWK